MKQWIPSLLIAIVVMIVFPIRSYAQLSGRLTDESNQPVAAANVLLLRLSDSALSKGHISQRDGSFLFQSVSPGEYFLRVQMPGFNVYDSETIRWPSPVHTLDLGDIELQPRSVDLEEVDITAERQFLEQKIDRLVVNVSNSVTSAGNTALEVLERAPGVILDRANNVMSLAGKNGVIVMINGRRSYMPISGVIQMLAGMPSDQIEKIELITTPPANFDAEGNAGYINIILKENSDYGFNGSLSASLGYGRGVVTNESLSLNYRRNKVNLFGSYDFSLDRREQEVIFQREYVDAGQQIMTNTRSDRFPQQRNHNLRLGMDYQLSKKTILGVLVSGYDNEWTMDALNNATFTYEQQPDTMILLDNQELNYWQHAMGNVNLQHKFSERSTLTFNGDYLYYRDQNPTDYLNQYFDEQGELLREEELRSDKTTPIQITVGTLDYEQKLGKASKLTTGIKATISRFTNDVSVAYGSGEGVIDPSLSGIFFLEEEIGAAYAAVEGALGKKTTYKVGLRYEYTNSNLRSATQDNIVDRQYGNLFPSIFLTRTLSEAQSVNLSYSRRITRPTFNDMAPFVIFIDPQSFFSGNAALQPAISNSVKVDYRLKQFMFSLSFTHEDSSIANFQPQFDEATNRQIIAAENLRSMNIAGLDATLPIKVTSWWEMQYNLNAFWTQINFYVDEDLLRTEQITYGGFGMQRFQLPWNLRGEISGFFRSPRRFAVLHVNAIYGLNVGLSRSFGPNGDGGTLTINVRDILNSVEYRGSVDQPEYNLVSNNRFDMSQRTFSVGYSRSFGSNKVRAARQRQTASEEERQRVN